MSYFYMPKEEYISKKELKANGIGVLLNAKEIELTNEEVIEILDSQRPKPYYKTINMAYDKAIEALSRNNKPLTDSEQRIFLSAIEKEKEVCRKIDDEYDGLIDLVGVCYNIERKVKNALWQ